MTRFSHGLIGLALAAWVLTACAGSSPSIRVIGIGESKGAMPSDELIVLVEVVNPSETELVLSKLKYRLEFASLSPLTGSMLLSRTLRPRSSEIFQIPMQRGANANSRVAGLGYKFVGRLFAVDRRLERSWPVSTKGTFRGNAKAVATFSVHTR